MQNLASVRTAGAFSQQHAAAFARKWLDLSRLQSSGYTPTISSGELAALIVTKQHEENLEFRLRSPLKQLGFTLGDALSGNTKQLPWRIDDPDVVAMIQSYIDDLIKSDQRDDRVAMRKFFAARNEDWIVPMGYAAARILEDRALPKEVGQRLRSYELKIRGRRLFDEIPSDPIQIIRRADEAGDISFVADAILRGTQNDRQGELFKVLLGYFQSWRAIINEDVPGPASVSEGTPDRPPKPGPVRNSADLQKGRWGGQSERNGRRLTAELGEVSRGLFLVDLIVSSTDKTPLQGPVVFHLHDSFPRSVIHIRRIRDGRRATLEEVSSEGVFTVGAQVKDAYGSWIGLELDLATLKGIPARFLDR
jgi:hypothetical protein